LDLSHNDISDTGISAVALAVERLKVLRVLKLNGNGFSSEGVAQLVTVLKPSTTLKRLEMCSNRIGDDGAELIAEQLIKFHSSLEELYIDSNLIGNDGISCIGEAMLRNRVLRVLSVGDNRIYPYGADRLCVHLRWVCVLLYACNTIYTE
jgi:Ran GTPase-activating protein (RanGAP) involved in mRNA processing and transport